MSKEVSVSAWCDSPAHSQPRVPAVVERTVVLDSNQPVLLDLCQTCDEGLVGLLANGAQVPVKAVKGASVVGTGEWNKTTTTCPICGRVSPTRSAMGTHMKGRHNIGVREYNASLDSVTPVGV